MTEKRFTIIDKQFISYYGGYGHQISDGECKFWLWHNKEESQKVCNKLNNLIDENEQLKQSVNNLKDIIIKITIAYQRKYDRNIVDLVHEVYDEDITDLIKELQE